LAIIREKQIKVYFRMKKLALIDSLNPKWVYLYSEGRIDWEIIKRR
jgi:predicted GIY-YIG superfamily endonuclease